MINVVTHYITAFVSWAVGPPEDKTPSPEDYEEYFDDDDDEEEYCDEHDDGKEEIGQKI